LEEISMGKKTIASNGTSINDEAPGNAAGLFGDTTVPPPGVGGGSQASPTSGHPAEPDKADTAARFDPGELEGGEEVEAAPAPAIADEKIDVGAGGILSIPREEIEYGDDEEEEEVGGSLVRIRKPGRREYFIMGPARELPVRLLVHKPKGPDTMDEELYYVVPQLRKGIGDELKSARVFLCYSVTARQFWLWVVKVTIDNSWYSSLQDKLLRHPPEFFRAFEVRVKSDKDASCYRVFKRTRSVQSIPWPDRPLNDLLAEALGASKIITSPDHPLYADLMSGEEVR
jgi:hypothetical protein